LKAEVVSVGSELLLGQIVDTNSAAIARHLAAIGLDLFYKTTVGDNLARLTDTLRQALERSDVVITTGGIGPTADDVTREAVAAATGRELVYSEHLMGQIEAFFAARGMRPSPSNRRQAYIPADAIPVENPVGTAPAFIVERKEKTLITLPGVPREMEHLFVTRILPYLRQRLRVPGVIRLRVLKAVGLGESRIGELLADFMETGANPTVGTLAHLGQVDVRIAAKAADAAAAERLIGPVESEIRTRLGDAVFGADDATLEGEVAARLRAARARLALAEVGGAGVASGRLAAAAPAQFAGGLVLADTADVERLGLVAELGGTAGQRGAALARAIAKWAAAGVGAALCLEALPGTTPPVTSVVTAVAAEGHEELREQRMGGDAASIRARAATLLLDLVRRALPPGGP
jgi:nicotinamide-nucleotide amidase